MSSRFTDRALSVIGLAVWAVAVGAGIGALLRYSNTAGVIAAPLHRWPDASSLRRVDRRATLLVFAHPQCPCTAATLDELADIDADTRQTLDVHVIFYAPEQASQAWVRSASWRRVADIPGFHPVEDWGGKETRRFQVATSGQTLLYDDTGNLRFSGGITPSRGHVGSNYGRDSVVALALTGAAPRETTPVFGCSLLIGYSR
ncbi:MAG: RedB protein [Bryobacteraceae bacterium]